MGEAVAIRVISILDIIDERNLYKKLYLCNKSVQLLKT